MQQPDKRQELLEQFRESLKRPIAERFFDEDELVTIFDFAGDLENDYIRCEVLMLGARLYPDSEVLLERRAIYYDDFEGNESVNFLLDNDSHEGAMWQIMKLRRIDCCEIVPDETKAFDYLIDQFDTFNDEEVVQLIKTIEERNVSDWLINNFDKILSKVSYQPILYFEAAMLFEREVRFDAEVKMLDKLVELEPFSSAYWMMLASAQLNLENYQAANQAIEYSLALNPDDADAQILQVNILRELKGEEVALEYLLKSYYTVNHNPITARIVTLMYDKAGKRAKLKEHVKETLEDFPKDLFMVCDALRLHVGSASKILKEYLEFIDPEEDIDPSQWMTMVLYLMSEGAYKEADEAIKQFNRATILSLPDPALQYLAAYRAGKLDRCEKLLKKDYKMISSMTMTDHTINILIFYAVVLAKRGAFDEALKYLDEIDKVKIADMPIALDIVAHYKGIFSIAKEVRAKIEDPNTDWSTYDPFSL
jgi:tetratricopeptide (TPR) repeat protein